MTATVHRSGPRAGASLVLGLLMAFTAVGCGSDGPAANGSAVDVETFQTRMAEPDMVVLDVRTPEEYAAGHLAGAVNIDLESADFSERIDELDPKSSYDVYCRSDNRSGVAVEEMVDDGFVDVVHLDGGIVDWESVGGDIVVG